MATYEAAVEIDRPPDAIFSFLVEPDRLRRWVSGFVQAEPLTSGPPRVGSRSIDLVRDGGREMRFETEIVEYVPPHGLSVTIGMPGMRAVSEYQLERRGLRTRVSHVQRVRYDGVLRVIGPLMGGMVRRKLRHDLLRLKAVVESGD